MSLTLSTALAGGFATPALAQSSTPPLIFPVHQTVDQNGVDLSTGEVLAGMSASIGTPASGMTLTRTYRKDTYKDS